jgi:tetratricopeptide (TPR) repeat protein
MTARAEIGYASALLYRRILAGMSGHRLNPIFEARPVICRAIRRLEAIPEDVPERKEAMFQAYVTLALAWYLLEATRQAEECLRQARCVLPSRYGVDPRYLYAAGLVESRLRSSVPVLRNAVEQDPRFETAQFHLALRTEMMWRRRPSFESTVAKIVGKEYEQVLKLNPGNIRAWANLGYVWWLQGDREKAREAFDRGREYKQIQRGTDVGAIDYGLARVAAEEKRLDDAYIHYLAAVCAHVTHGVSDARITSSQYYFFDYVGDAMLARYEAFANAVLEECDRSVPGHDATPRRVRDAVAGFVLNDLGEALHTYYIRNADGDAARRAREAYQEALRRNPTFVLLNYNLYLMAMNDGDIQAALDQIRHVHDLEPTWPEAILARVAALAEWANDQTWRQPVERRQAQRDEIPTAHAPPRRRAEAGKGTDARVGTTIVLTPDVKRSAQAITNDTAVMEQLERLVPHSWWWRRADGGTPTFEWQAVQGLDAERARDMDDLHVRSLFMWDIANLIIELEHRPLEEPGVPADPEAPVDPETTSMARLLLDKIKEHFWPANPRVLLTWRQIHRDEAADEDLRALVRHWLGADPTSQWALQHLRREFFDFYGNKVALFEEEEQRAYLEKARDESHLRLGQADGADRAMSSVLAWVEAELGSMRAAEASADGKETSETEASAR